jgi:hypothetical protein
LGYWILNKDGGFEDLIVFDLSFGIVVMMPKRNKDD